LWRIRCSATARRAVHRSDLHVLAPALQEAAFYLQLVIGKTCRVA
jgi:hypothetical protein